MSQEEKRCHKRVKGDIAIAISDAESNMISEAKDISVSGVSFKINKEMPLMTKVIVTLLLPGPDAKGKKNVNKINCPGVVVRSEPLKAEPGSREMAVFFADLEKSKRKALEKYVTYMESKD